MDKIYIYTIVANANCQPIKYLIISTNPTMIYFCRPDWLHYEFEAKIKKDSLIDYQPSFKNFLTHLKIQCHRELDRDLGNIARDLNHTSLELINSPAIFAYLDYSRMLLIVHFLPGTFFDLINFLGLYLV